jgi:hypothetical protein
MNMKMWMMAATLAVAATGLTRAATVQPSPRDMTRAVKQFLAEHGDLCMAKYTWPRDVTAADRDAHSNDAVQLPVLERLGLVASTQIPLPAPAVAISDAPASAPAAAPVEPDRRYSLTAKGRRYYLQKKRTTLNVHSEPVEHDADFCVARLSLDKVVKWTPPEQVHDHLQTVARYTYKIKAAVWLSEPDARKVFPVVDRIIRGAGTLEMTATVQQQNGKWVPVLPGQ